MDLIYFRLKIYLKCNYIISFWMLGYDNNLCSIGIVLEIIWFRDDNM